MDSTRPFIPPLKMGIDFNSINYLNSPTKDSDEESTTQNHENILTHRKSVEDGLVMEILMDIDEDGLEWIKEQFHSSKGKKLNLYKFVDVMKSYILNKFSEKNVGDVSTSTLIANLCVVFEEVDVNGDNWLEWQEFLGFLIDQDKMLHKHIVENIKNYSPSALMDTSLHHFQGVENLFYFQEIQKLFIFERNKNIKVYNPFTRTPIKDLQQGGTILKAEYIPSHHTLVTSSTDKTINFWDANTAFSLKKRLRTINSQYSLAWDNFNNILYTGDSSGKIQGWNYSDLSRQCVLREHTKLVTDMVVLPDLKLLASSSMDTDNSILVWDLFTGLISTRLNSKQKGVFNLAYNQEHHYLLSASASQSILVWNPHVESVVSSLEGHRFPLIGVKTVQNTPQVLSVDKYGIVKLWDIRTFECVQTLSVDLLPGSSLSSFAVCPRKEITDQRVTLITAGDKLDFFEYSPPPSPLLTDGVPPIEILYNEPTATFITCGGNNVKIWDARTGKLRRIFRAVCEREISALCLDNRQRKFIVGDVRGEIKMFNYNSGLLIKSFEKHSGEISGLAYFKKTESKILLSSSYDGNIFLHSDSDPYRGVLIKIISHTPSQTSTLSPEITPKLPKISSPPLDRTNNNLQRSSTKFSALSLSPKTPQQVEKSEPEQKTPRNIAGGLYSTGIICFDMSHSLSLIATGGVDGVIMLWDEERTSNEGKLVHNFEVTNICFVENVSALVSTDSKGTIYFWAVRPSPNKNQCLLTFDNLPSVDLPIYNRKNFYGKSNVSHYTPNTSIPVLCMAYSEETRRLYTGDEIGFLKAWNLGKVIDSYFQPIAEIPVHRKSFRTLSLSTSFRKTPSMLQVPKLSSSDVSLYKEYQAHNDAITCLSLVSSPHCIITGSFDLTVKICDNNLNPLGSLHHGFKFSQKPDYLFKVNEENIQKMENIVVNQVLEKLKNKDLNHASVGGVYTKDSILESKINISSELQKATIQSTERSNLVESSPTLQNSARPESPRSIRSSLPKESSNSLLQKSITIPSIPPDIESQPNENNVENQIENEFASEDTIYSVQLFTPKKEKKKPHPPLEKRESSQQFKRKNKFYSDEKT